MANDEFKQLLDERGWTVFRGGDQIVISKGDYRITLKKSKDLPGKLLVIRGSLQGRPKHDFFDSSDDAFRDLERFIRQESKPTQPQISRSYSRGKRGVSYEEVLEEAIRTSPDVSQLSGGRQELENVVNYVYMNYSNPHNIYWNGERLSFYDGERKDELYRTRLHAEGVL